MKKIYLMLIVLMVASVSFAQVQRLESAQQNNLKLPLQKKAISTKSNASYWFSYTEALAAWWQADLNRSTPPTYGNLMCSVEFSNGTAQVQHGGLGQVFDFAHPTWNDFYSMLPVENQPPFDMSETGRTYTIDSVYTVFWYLRGTELVDTNIVDTLVFSIVTGMNETNFPLNAGRYMTYQDVPYEINKLMVDENHSLFPAGADLAVIKVPMTREAFDWNTEYGQEVVIPVGITTSEKSFFVFYSFKPGMVTTVDDIFGKDCNAFYTLAYDDPRADFFTDCDTTAYIPGEESEMWSESNNSYDVTKYTMQDSILSGGTMHASAWYQEITPVGLWCAEWMRPYFLVRITSEEGTGVAEKTAAGIAVRPNPATNYINVDLAAEGTADVEMFNLVGQKVFSDRFTTQTATINVNNFNSGIYMLKVTQNGKVFTSKVVVK